MLYLDCSMGVAGDMLVASLLDLGASQEELKKVLNDFAKIRVREVERAGRRALTFEPKPKLRLRSFGEMVELVQGLDLPEGVKGLVLRILRILREAEEEVHKCEEPKLKELADCFIDALAFSLALHNLGLLESEVVASSVGVGKLAPASKVIITSHRIPVRLLSSEFETATPTGLAILAAVVSRFSDEKSRGRAGVGAGRADLRAYPNVVEAVLSDELFVLETNIDDCSPEVLANAAERLLEEGAIDFHIISCVMKKGRPGFLLRVLTKDPERHARLLMEETGTLGVRYSRVGRFEAEREEKRVKLEVLGEEEELGVKESEFSLKPEFEELRRISKRRKIPMSKLLKDLSRLSKA